MHEPGSWTPRHGLLQQSSLAALMTVSRRSSELYLVSGLKCHDLSPQRLVSEGSERGSACGDTSTPHYA